MVNLCYLLKLKRGLGLVLGAHFLHDFSIKKFLFNTLSIDKVKISYHFSFSRYQTKCSIRFLFRQLMMSQKRNMEIQKFEYLKNEKSFLDEIKSNFHNHLRATIW